MKPLELWKDSDFAIDYINRNQMSEESFEALLKRWSRILSVCLYWPVSKHSNKILEVGCNTGNNLAAIAELSNAKLHGVEPNQLARDIANTVCSVIYGTADDIPAEDKEYDLVFTSGVLIHIHPDNLKKSLDEIYRVSKRYILSIEYFSDKPEVVEYHGMDKQLFKRDFGSEWLKYKLKLIDYGFFWKGDDGLDNLNWWLFEK